MCLFVFLYSCSGGSDPKKLSALGNYGSSEPEEEDRPVREILTMTTVSPPAMLEFLEEAVKRFNAQNDFGVEIELKNYGTEMYKEELALKMAVNEAPDIFFTWESGFLHSFVSSGKVYEIGQALQADPEWKKGFVDGIFADVSFGGSVYALPLVQNLAVVYYNKALFEEYGVQAPTTYEEFLTVCRLFAGADVTPFAISGQLDWACGQLFLQLLCGVGGKELYEGLINGSIPWKDQRVLRAAEELSGLQEEGFLPADVLDISMYEALRMMTGGEAAMYFDGSWSADTGGLSQEEYGAFLLPAYYEAYRGVGIGSIDQCYAVSAECKNKEAACAFLKTLYTRQAQERLQRAGYISVCVDKEQSADGSPLLMGEISRLNEQLEYKLAWFDRKLGAEQGGRVNRMAQQLLCGYDPQALLEELAAWMWDQK